MSQRWIARVARQLWQGVRYILSRGREPLAVMVLGVVTFLVVCLVRDYSFIGDEELGIRDRAQEIRADTNEVSTPPPFVLIDFQQSDYAAFGYPVVAPRAVLARVLALAGRGQPRLIVVDIDLGIDGGGAELMPVLKALAEDPKAPPVLLVRRPLVAGKAGGPDVILPTDYDGVVDATPRMMWVSAHAQPDGDGVTRRYYVSRLVHRGSSRLILPGIQAAACAALQRDAGLHRLRQAIAAPNDSFTCGNADWPLAKPDETSEITYTMSWQPREGRRRPQLDIGGDKVEEIETHDALELSRLDARALPNPAALFATRVVIIGSSADQADDIHGTSIGEMPGILVEANAIRSGLHYGRVARDGMGFSIALTALMSLVTWLVWCGIRTIRLGHLVFEQAAAPLLNVAWLFVISVMLPAAHGEAFLYPQVLVALALVIHHVFIEGRKRSRPQKETSP